MKNIYIASCTPDGGILHCLLDDAGKLIPREFVHLDRPMYMVMGKAFLHVLLRAPFPDNDNSGLVSVPLDAGGCMGKPASVCAVPGRVSAHLSLGRDGIYTANYVSGDICLLSGRNVFHGEGAHPHYIAPTPDGEFIAVADLGKDSIYLYSPELEPVQRLSLPPGSGCRHLTFSPDGNFAYCANELGSSVSIFRYVPGRLELIRTAAILPEDFTAFNAPAAIRCTDECVYVSQRGYDHISCFHRHGAELPLKDHIPCGGRWPRDFWLLSPYIICANEKSDCITVIRGKDIVSSLELSCPVCVIAD